MLSKASDLFASKTKVYSNDIISVFDEYLNNTVPKFEVSLINYKVFNITFSMGKIKELTSFTMNKLTLTCKSMQ